MTESNGLYCGDIPDILAILYDRPASFDRIRYLLETDSRCVTVRDQLLQLVDAGMVENGQGAFKITQRGKGLVDRWHCEAVKFGPQ